MCIIIAAESMQTLSITINVVSYWPISSIPRYVQHKQTHIILSMIFKNTDEHSEQKYAAAQRWWLDAAWLFFASLSSPNLERSVNGIGTRKNNQPVSQQQSWEESSNQTYAPTHTSDSRHVCFS